MEKKKNVIWIMTDQQRAETLSINGCENASTPNIDMLARTGANFTSATSGYPLCCPFRGALLSGRYPHKCVPGHEYQLPPSMPTIANVFNDNGYDTFYLGKWHLDGAKERDERAGTHIVPRENRGSFKSWLGYENNNAQYDCYLHGHRQEEDVEIFKLPKYETDAITDIFIDYIEEKSHGNEPFFAVMSVQPPHDPYVAPPEYLKNHMPNKVIFRENVPNVKEIRDVASQDLAGYYAMVENIDANVGRIINTLEETGLMDDTHIIFFSDHGDMHGSHGQFRKMTPYQEAVNIPFIISGEKRGSHATKRYVGNIDNVPINHVDITSTTLGLCGIDIPDYMEGTDYSAYRLLDKEKIQYPTSAYMQSVIPTKHHDSVNRPWRGIITIDGYKYVCFENMDWFLFDLNTDPFEQVNLAYNDRYIEIRKRLNKELNDWIIKTDDDFVLPII